MTAGADVDRPAHEPTIEPPAQLGLMIGPLLTTILSARAIAIGCVVTPLLALMLAQLGPAQLAATPCSAAAGAAAALALLLPRSGPVQE